MKANYSYDFILPYYKADDELRPNISQISKENDGYIYATNSHIAIRVPHEKVCMSYEKVERFPNAAKLIQEATTRKGDREVILKTQDLIKVLATLKWRHDKYGEECKACEGEGEIECEHCESIVKCKECNGKGEVNFKVTEYSLVKCDYYMSIKIDTHLFRANYLHQIAFTAQMLRCDEINLKYNPNDVCSCGVFRFNNIDIILMPVSPKCLSEHIITMKM